MPPRSRTKPGSTTRRPKVAGLRQHAHATTGTRPLDAEPIDGVEPQDRVEAPDAVDATEDSTVATTDDGPAVEDAPEATAGDEAGTTGTTGNAAPADEEAPRSRDEADVLATDADPAPGGTQSVSDADTSATTDTVTSATTGTAAGTYVSTATPADAPDDDTATLPAGGDGMSDAGEASDEDRPAARTAAPTRTGRGRSTGRAGESSRRRAGMAVRGDGAGTATQERPGRRQDEDGDDEAATVATTTEKRGTKGGTPKTGDAPSLAARVRAGLARFAGSRALPVTLVAVTVVCLVLAGLAFWKGLEARTSGPYANQAVVDVSATAELVGQTRESIEKIFSYDYTRLDDSVEAARTMSTGQFTERYLSVFDQTIRDPAMQQQLRQTATAVNMGVVSLRDDRAEVMVLAQFSAQRTSTGQSTNAPGLLRAEMHKVDGRWKLAELNPLTSNR